jgi:hypothetical protein
MLAVKGSETSIHSDLVLLQALVDLFLYSPHHLLNLTTTFAALLHTWRNNLRSDNNSMTRQIDPAFSTTVAMAPKKRAASSQVRTPKPPKRTKASAPTSASQADVFQFLQLAGGTYAHDYELSVTTG